MMGRREGGGKDIDPQLKYLALSDTFQILMIMPGMRPIPA